MDFNHCKDKNIGKTGFLAHHHLVRYYLKLVELNKIEDELKRGSVEAAPAGAILNNFWEKLITLKNQHSLDKAIAFIDVYVESLHKHKKNLLYLNYYFLLR